MLIFALFMIAAFTVGYHQNTIIDWWLKRDMALRLAWAIAIISGVGLTIMLLTE